MGCESEICDSAGAESGGWPRKAVCPLDHMEYRQVSRRTILHHLRHPWARELSEQGYYFCTSPECDVVYFGEDGMTINRAELHSVVGQKSRAPDRQLCYCFDVRLTDLTEKTSGSPGVREYVVAQTRTQNCACEIRNPSGRCCLGDFPGTKKTSD